MPQRRWNIDVGADKLLRQGDQTERKHLLRILVGKMKLMPKDLEVSISYRLPQPIVNGLVAGVFVPQPLTEGELFIQFCTPS